MTHLERLTPVVKFKTSILNSRLCDHCEAYILVKGTITVFGVGTTAAARAIDRESKQVILKFFAPFTDSVSKITNTQVDIAKDLDV